MTYHNDDFYEWIHQQATLLREKRFNELDIENLVAELESMGRWEKHDLESHLEQLLAYLLMWRFCLSKKNKQLELNIEEQRLRIINILHDNPSLENHLTGLINNIYPLVVIKVELETGMSKKDFPNKCPWSWKTVLNSSILVL
ncbi:hypothetical protein BAC3_00029 [uncultured bacterium]|nr:hypothetical protein BAC3_00029 [uncultured bacterium]